METLAINCIVTNLLRDTYLNAKLAFRNSHTDVFLTDFLKKNDVYAKLEIARTIIEKYVYIHTDASGNLIVYDRVSRMPVTNAVLVVQMKFVYEIVNEIGQNISDIDNTIIKHKEKWFNAWRIIDYTDSFKQLKMNMDIFIERFDFLIKIFELPDLEFCC